ncbi:MAG: hypothetical protein KC613_22610, partial [Myxococcales bacterium]|nr:hypothetical protein [Myxococcales bacterium]
QFQAELAQIQATYEDQLADLCGVFQGDDGVVYPAIARYGDRSELTTAMGDPCGLMQSGQIHDATVAVEGQMVALRAVAAQINTALETVEIERRRVSAQCGLVFELADFQYSQSGRTKRLDEEIRLIRFGLSRADRVLGHANSVLQFTSAAATCTPLPLCSAQKAAAGAVYLAAATVVEVGAAIGELFIEDKQRELVQIERETARWETQAQCDTLIVDGNARMAEVLLQLKELELEQLRAEVGIQQALANVDEARVRARRVQQQQRQAEQLQINAAAARTDPNVRLYRNDAIINADLSFEDAMREAWRLTRIYEYYTAQTYAEQDRLFFIRLVGRGDDNLDNYLTDLSNAFNAFEEEAGLPDSRVLLVSLKDDILKVPHVDDAGNPLSPGERTARMREALRDPKYLDEQGFITLPFNTDLADVSPLTRNHKLFALEAEIIASDFGDHVGRLYVSQRGTGVVRNADDGLDFYRLPARTAVINPFFNGSRFFDPTIYRNFRLRDRPLVNTAWELVINLRTEQANADLDLQSLTDVRLFVYYTDFTRPF